MIPFEWFIFLPLNIFWPHFNSPLARNFDFDNTRIDTRQPQTDGKQTGWWKTLAKSYKTFVFTSVLSFDVVIFLHTADLHDNMFHNETRFANRKNMMN